MATLNPLLDAVPSSQLAPAQLTPTQQTVPPNLMLAVLRRWPWLVLGIAAGLVFGLMYHMQRAPVYQSTAQLMVLKNRPEIVTSSAGDARVQLVEDYVAGQVILLQSERILKIAAEKRLDEQKPFEIPPPAGVSDRVNFLQQHFKVLREKEPGAASPSNVLQLTFRGPNPTDATKYLRAIINAYRDELSGFYEEASKDRAAALMAEINRLRAAENRDRIKREALYRELYGTKDPVTGVVTAKGISQEDLSSIRNRITANRTAQTTLTLKEIEVDRQLKDIKEAGNDRGARIALLLRYDLPSSRGWFFNPEPKDLDGNLELLKFKRRELSNRLGPGHPEMQALESQIRTLEEEQQRRGGPAGDELDRYQQRLMNDKSAIANQLKILDEQIAVDEKKALEMGAIQYQIDMLDKALLDYTAQIRATEREKEQVSGTSTAGGYKVQEVTTPTAGVQVAPVLLQSLLLGCVLGLLLGGGLALRAELADRSFRSPEDIRRHLGIPVLGHVPLIRTNEPAEVTPSAPLDPVLVVYLRPHSSEAEAVRGIRTQVLFNTQNKDHQVIQVTSPNPADGKSTFAANLAVALAGSDKRVLLVDCDFRKPRVHRIFALPHPEMGLASVVADQADLGAAVQSCEIENLSILPCGPRPANPAELLTSLKFQEILTELRSSYDIVILDTPPVLAVSDPAAVAPRADGVILVFRMTKDARPACERSRDDLLAVGGKLLGVVVNASTERDMGYGYGYGYRYRYDYQYSDSYADPAGSADGAQKM